MSINPDPGEENMGYYLYRYTLQNQEGDLTYAAFLGVVFTVIVIPLAFGVRKLFDRSEN
jgi:ABC-type sugar transport system permease subunit